MRGEGEPSSQVWSSKGRVVCREEEPGAELVPEAQDSSLCTATVMLSCFWIMMFLERGKRAEGAQLCQEELAGVGSGQGNH